MRGDGGIDQIAPQPPEPRQGTILIRAGKAAVSDHICRQNRGKFPSLAHDCPCATIQTSTMARSERAETQSYRYCMSDVRSWPLASLGATQRYVCNWGRSGSVHLLGKSTFLASWTVRRNSITYSIRIDARACALRVTPAMVANVTDRVWLLEELVNRTSK